MARFTYRKCRGCGDLHEVSDWPDACVAAHFGAEPARRGPHIISDTIEPFRSMASAKGEVFSSKSRYRADLKARGMIEVGNERVSQKPAPLPRARHDVRRALQELRG